MKCCTNASSRQFLSVGREIWVIIPFKWFCIFIVIIFFLFWFEKKKKRLDNTLFSVVHTIWLILLCESFFHIFFYYIHSFICLLLFSSSLYCCSSYFSYTKGLLTSIPAYCYLTEHTNVIQCDAKSFCLAEIFFFCILPWKLTHTKFEMINKYWVIKLWISNAQIKLSSIRISRNIRTNYKDAWLADIRYSEMCAFCVSRYTSSGFQICR